MKVGIDCRLWNETGVGRYIRNLVDSLAEIDTTTQYILFFRKEAYETVPLPGKNFSKRLADIRWHTMKEQTAFASLLQKEQCDLVHFPYFSYPIFYTGKFVITIHDLILNHFPTGQATTLPSPLYWVKQIGYRFVLSQAIHRSSKILAVSKATRDEIIDHYSVKPEKIVVTYEGIDAKLLQKKMEKVDTPHPYFFYVGNAYPHKNLERLVDGFADFIKHEKDVVDLIFVGKEDFFYKRLKEKVLRQAQNVKGLSERIHFFQNISDNQLVYLYHHAKGVVLPSLMEGFGLPALEAMANNCLVIASEIAAFLEVCGDAGVYFDPYNPHDIAQVLQHVYEGKVGTEEKKRKGEKRAKLFSWKKMAQQTLAVYESSIGIRSSQ